MSEQPEQPREVEYALARLDKWFASCFNRNYTPDVAEEVERRAREYFTPEEKDTLEEMLGEFAKWPDRDFLSEIYTSEPFSHFYESQKIMQQLVSSIEQRDLPKSVKTEYLGPLLKSTEIMVKKVNQVIDNVRKVADEKFPDELTDEDVRQAYFDAMGGIEGAQKILNSFFESTLLATDLAVRRGEASQEQYQAIEKLKELSEDLSPLIIKAIFKEK